MCSVWVLVGVWKGFGRSSVGFGKGLRLERDIYCHRYTIPLSFWVRVSAVPVTYVWEGFRSGLVGFGKYLDRESGIYLIGVWLGLGGDSDKYYHHYTISLSILGMRGFVL